MKRTLPIVVAVAAVVALAWWWFHRGGSSEVAGTGSAKAGPVDKARVQGSAEAPEAIAMPVLDDDDPPGAMRLEGQVVDAADQPVGGATVVLASTPPRTVVTEGDGSFAFTGLVGRTYRLLARGTKGVAGPVTVWVTAHTEQVVLHLRAGASMKVTVADTTGKPVDGATVELRGVDDQRAMTVGGLAAFASVVPGPYEIVAWAPGMAHVFQATRIMGATTARLVLVAGAAVSGTVVDDGGKPVAGARVLYAASGQLLEQADPRLDAVTSDASGAFAFEALPAGSFRFSATHPDHAPGVSSLVTLDGTAAKTGVVVTLPPGATIRGRVVDTAKQPVAGARIQISIARQRGGGRGGPGGQGGPPQQRTASHQAYSDAKGEFEIKGLPRTALTATASHELGASRQTELDASGGDVRDVVLVLDLTAVIAGTVVDPEGNPVEGAQVTASPQRGGDGPPRGGRRDNQDVSDGSGRFKITGLAEGEYSIRASRSPTANFGRRNRGGGDGVDAKTGDANVKIVLPAEGNVAGKVAFANGGAPTVFTVSVGPIQQSFLADGAFELDGIAPGQYTLLVRGPQFDTKQQDVTVDPGKTADLGTLVLVQGRQLAGTVVSNNSPVAGATVYAGRQVMGGGSTNDSPAGGAGGFGAGAKTDTTAADGTFSLAGFGDGDLTLVADLPGVGRSKALRITQDQPGQTQLVVELQPYGSLSGTVKQDAGSPPVAVTVQSTTTPGAVNIVSAGADGTYRFDHLAPDTYKVSATLGSIRRGLKLYSKQVDVPAGKEVTVDLSVDLGAVTFDVTPTSTKPVGVVIGYLASAPISATTAQDVSLKLAAAGPGNSQVVIARPGSPAEFDAVAPGAYTVCLVALPSELTSAGGGGGGVQGYLNAHGGSLAAVCQAAPVAASPATQAISIAVTIPAMIANGSAH